MPFTLLDCYRFSHPSHRPHEVPGPLWRLGPFFSYSCQFPIQWYFLISLMLLVLRGLHFSHPPSSHSWVLYFLVFHGDCGSILSSLVSSKPVFSIISHYIRRMHIKNAFVISAIPCLFLSFLQVSPLCGITCPCSLSTSMTDSSLLGLFCCPFSSH